MPLHIRSSLVLVAGNWKMFKGPAETVAFLDASEAPDGVEIVVCPPFTSLAAAASSAFSAEMFSFARSTHFCSLGRFSLLRNCS